jgi:hypothetical protein
MNHQLRKNLIGYMTNLSNGWVNDDCMVKAYPTLKLQILYTIKIVEIKLWPPLAHVKDTKPCWLASTCLAYFETYCFNMFSASHYKVCRKSFNKVWWPQCNHIHKCPSFTKTSWIDAFLTRALSMQGQEKWAHHMMNQS